MIKSHLCECSNESNNFICCRLFEWLRIIVQYFVVFHHTEQFSYFLSIRGSLANHNGLAPGLHPQPGYCQARVQVPSPNSVHFRSQGCHINLMSITFGRTDDGVGVNGSGHSTNKFRIDRLVTIDFKSSREVIITAVVMWSHCGW